MNLGALVAEFKHLADKQQWAQAGATGWLLWRECYERAENIDRSTSTGGGVDVRSAERQNLPRKSPLVRNLDWQVELARQNAVAQIEAAQRNQDSKIETPGKEPAMIQDYADVSAGGVA
jgi:hypothetical protein